jgi:uncharacterized protein (TIGR02145 family)
MKKLSVAVCLIILISCEKTEETENETPLVTITDYDGNTYSTIKIGNQQWMVNNLKTTHYADGTEITLVESTSTWEALGYDEKAYCYYNNNENSESNTYGALYTWAAAMNGAESSDNNPSSVQGVCPDGWHLPSDNEWKEMEMYLGMSQADADLKGYRGTNQGCKLAGSANLWYDGFLENDDAFGASGFMALPGGGRRYDGSFGHLGDNANFWSATQNDSLVAWGRHLYSSYSTVHRYSNIKSDGFSVRCVKDN